MVKPNIIKNASLNKKCPNKLTLLGHFSYHHGVIILWRNINGGHKQRGNKTAGIIVTWCSNNNGQRP